MMKRLFTFILSVGIIFSMVMPCFAANVLIDDADGIAKGDVFAKYVCTYEWSETEVANGTAEVMTKNGYVVSVTGAPEAAVKLVIFPIPSSDAAAWNWLDSCIVDEYILLNAFDIYFKDSDGNRINANDVQITIRKCDDKCLVFSVKTDGQSTKLNSTNEDGMFFFTADGSNYYALTIKDSSTKPTDLDETTTTDKPAVPTTGDDIHIVLWFALAVVSGVILLWLCFYRKKHKSDKE